jgi:hypothetical protein
MFGIRGNTPQMSNRVCMARTVRAFCRCGPAEAFYKNPPSGKGILTRQDPRHWTIHQHHSAFHATGFADEKARYSRRQEAGPEQ